MEGTNDTAGTKSTTHTEATERTEANSLNNLVLVPKLDVLINADSIAGLIESDKCFSIKTENNRFHPKGVSISSLTNTNNLASL